MFKQNQQFLESSFNFREDSPRRPIFNHKVVTSTNDDIRSKVEEWFNALLLKRKLVASIGIACLASIALFIQTVITEFNILSPLTSIEQIFYNFTTFSFWFILFIQSVITFGLVFTLSHLIMSVVAPKTLSWNDGINLIFCSSLIVAEALIVFLIFFNSQPYDDNGTISEDEDLAAGRFFYNIFALIFVCTNFMFTTNFQYIFRDNNTPFQNVILSMIIPSIDSIYSYNYKTAIVGFKRASVLWILFQLITNFWGLKYVLTTGLAFYIAMTVYRIHITYNLAVKVINVIVMEPYHFEMPSCYNITEPTEKQARHIVNVFNCSNIMMKSFALYDVRYISDRDYKRRCEVFQLSIPGNYPRNWNSVKAMCLEIISSVNKSFIAGNDLIHTIKMGNVAHLYGDPSSRFRKTMDMRDPRRIATATGLSRRINTKSRGELFNEYDQLQDQSLKPEIVDYFGFIEKIKNFFVPLKTILYPIDGILSVYAIETISNMVAASVEEDEFGSVQSDVEQIVRELLKIYVNIQNYSRDKIILMHKYDVEDDEIINNIQSSIKKAVVRILSHFKNHIDNFNSDEQEIIQQLY